MLKLLVRHNCVNGSCEEPNVALIRNLNLLRASNRQPCDVAARHLEKWLWTKLNHTPASGAAGLYRGGRTGRSSAATGHRYAFHKAQRVSPAQFDEVVRVIVRQELKRAGVAVAGDRSPEVPAA
jgi:hypothetical protein